MKKGMKRSKKRAVSSKSAKRKRPVAAKAVRRPKAKSVKPKRKPAPPKPKPRAPAAPAKGPSVTTLQRRIQALEGEVQARAHDRVELARWQQYHSQLLDQVKAKDSMLAFKEKELLDLRRQCEELKAQAKKKDK
ncbi:MAG: hypothetical protein HYY12_03470 [Candidatus Methylomirabilis oxyfera]|nr:hypothetical protein [Candidatus Methylomirabilis oxyfera]